MPLVAKKCRDLNTLKKNMDNKELFQKVKELNFPLGQYALFGSGPMAIRGLRENRDADIIAADELFEVCRADTKWRTKRFDDGNEYLVFEEMELFKNWGPGEWDIGKLIKSSEIIDDLPFVNLENVLKWKKIYGREKDLKDVEIIENFLRTKL